MGTPMDLHHLPYLRLIDYYIATEMGGVGGYRQSCLYRGSINSLFLCFDLGNKMKACVFYFFPYYVNDCWHTSDEYCITFRLTYVIH